MSFRASESDASRQGSQLIVPVSSSGTPPNHDGRTTRNLAGQKRKHDAYAMEELLKHSIVVKPYPPKLSLKPRSLQPLMLLPRERLPISCLDLAMPLGEFEYSRFYESNIKILELESRMGNGPVVLIARLETNKTVYAIERQEGGLYSLCKLGNWVTLEDLSHHATVAYSTLLKTRNVPVGATIPEATTTPQLHRENKKRRLAIEAIQSLVKRPARSQSISFTSQASEATQDLSSVDNDEVRSLVDGVAALSKPVEPINADVPAEPSQSLKAIQDEKVLLPTASDILEQVRNQYLEALYLSRGSLAYFAKGPLSRARAAFHLDCDSNLEMDDLIDFLKSLVLTTIQIDKKYRETVPDIISKMKTYVVDSGDEHGAKGRKKKPKKMKLGKDGLYPSEDEHVRKWWNAHKPQLKDEEDTMTAVVPSDTKLQISCLRSRETQLQIIVILEILALEPLRTVTLAQESQLPGLSIDLPPAEPSQDLSGKKRNKHNFPVLLDVHADRLSIWQSTSLDEINMLGDTQSGGIDKLQKPGSLNSDPLKDFCVDIIVPFFSSRLPIHCDSLNRKLGGPVMPSPPKPKSKKAEIPIKPPPKPKAKSGAVARRTSSKSARTLERVLSKESEQARRSMSRGPSNVIALMRSASTPIVPLLKRETSDRTSLTSVPCRDSADAVDAHEAAEEAASIASSRRRTQEERAQKDAQIKAELQDAISGLRKPNREVVGKAMEEAAERRATTSLSQLRKSRKPIQHAQPPSIVKATPVGPRFRDALARDSQSRSIPRLAYPEFIEQAHSPSVSVIPSSAPRKRKVGVAFGPTESTPAASKYGGPVDSIGATPAKASILRRDPISMASPDEGVVLASSPVMSRKFLAVPGGALRHRDSGIGMPSSPENRTLVATPMKKSRPAGLGSLEGYITVTPAKSRTTHVEPTPVKSTTTRTKDSKSIFEMFGWDDDYDDLA
ncbi:DNA replication regulator SLD3-domain-containing protein [Xylariales sp. PMI_506]|nr:DNA replication regulator SLD3-domain-containing protein [Xylariales sp. PMI_506]